MQQKRIAFIIGFMLLLLAVAPVMAQAPVLVTIFVGLGTGTSPIQIQQQDALEARFNAEHTDIQIDFLIVPHDEAETRLIAMISGGNAPQLVGPNGASTIANYLEAWADITPFIEAENYDTSDFYGPTLEINNYPDKNVGLPLGIYPSFILYNADIFDAMGVDYPPTSYDDTSWTMDALREKAIAVTMDSNGNIPTSPDFDANDIVQWGFDDSWTDTRGRLVQWGAENMGRPTSPDYKTALFNSPEWVAGMQWYSDGIWKDHFIPGRPEDVATYEAAGLGSPFDGGLVGMFEAFTWYLSEIAPALPDLSFEIGTAPVPFNRNGQRIARINADNFNIPSTAEHQQEAWEVMKWLTSPEVIEDVCLIYGCVPARASVADSFRARLEETFPQFDWNIIFEAINYLDIPNHESWVPERAKVGDLLELASARVAQGETDIPTLMNETNAEVQKILDEYWASH